MEYDSHLKSASHKTIVLGARGSMLSRWHASHVAQQIQQAWPSVRVETQILRTTGDERTDIPLPQIGGKGVFTAEIEKALLAGEIDLAVHSQKDLPIEDSSGLIVGAVIKRENASDALVSRQGFTLDTLPRGASVGTSSTRRAAQILFCRPDLKLIDIRGNVDTRLNKALAAEGPYDAIILAYAGLLRINRADVATQIFSVDAMLPAPAQGALAVQCQKNSDILRLVSAINHLDTELCTLAERGFLKGLGGGCSLPVAAFAEMSDNIMRLRGNVIARDGRAKVDVELECHLERSNPNEAKAAAFGLGRQLAEQAMSRGADKLLLSD